MSGRLAATFFASFASVLTARLKGECAVQTDGRAALLAKGLIERQTVEPEARPEARPGGTQAEISE